MSEMLPHPTGRANGAGFPTEALSAAGVAGGPRTLEASWREVGASRSPASSDFHLECFSTLEGQRKTRHQLGYLFQVMQTHQLDRRMHVAVRQADQPAGNAAARPEDRVRVPGRVGARRFLLGGGF